MFTYCGFVLELAFFFRYSYPLMYRDVRSAVDLCHRDGTLKRMVAKDPSRYSFDKTKSSFFCNRLV